jgi:hypothetical protein
MEYGRAHGVKGERTAVQAAWSLACLCEKKNGNWIRTAGMRAYNVHGLVAWLLQAAGPRTVFRRKKRASRRRCLESEYLGCKCTSQQVVPKTRWW